LSQKKIEKRGLCSEFGSRRHVVRSHMPSESETTACEAIYFIIARGHIPALNSNVFNLFVEKTAKEKEIK